MEIGMVSQDMEFDSEILKSADYQLISITVDSTARYDASGAGSSVATTKLPKGLLLSLSTDLSDGTYEPLNTGTGELDTKQFIQNCVVLAETIKDISTGDQVVKAYYQGTFDWNKIKYNSDATHGLTIADLAKQGRLLFIDGPTS